MKSLEELSHEEKAYLPSESVQQALSRVPLVCVVGGVGVGKNYLMQRTGLPIVGRVTSRPKRPDDDPSVYTYYTNEEFIGMIERHELVQYAVDLGNGTIYGTVPKNYVFDTPNIADIWHWSVVELPEKGFKSVRAVSILTPVEQWQEQLELRFKGRSATYRKARLEEAKASLLWTKQQILLGSNNHAVIINDKNETDESVEKLITFAQGAELKVPTAAPELIENMVRFLSTTE